MTQNQPEKTASLHDWLSLDVHPGDALQLQEIEPPQQRYFAKLLGYANHQSLLVSCPQMDGKTIALSAGKQLRVRGFSGALTYEFDAKILQVCEHPYAYLHISFPDAVNTVVMRGAIRIRVNLQCSVVTSVGCFKLPATFGDLSTSGACLQSLQKLGKAGDTIQLHCRIPMDGEDSVFDLVRVDTQCRRTCAANGLRHPIRRRDRTCADDFAKLYLFHAECHRKRWTLIVANAADRLLTKPRKPCKYWLCEIQ